jgi:hypothetical protein
MFAKNAYVQIYMRDKLTQNDIGFQQHSYCNTNINVILLGYKLLYNDVNNGKTNWVSNVRDLLFSLGLNYV